MGKKVPQKNWSNDNIHLAYKLASVGYTDKEIASELGVTKTTFMKWRREYPAFKNAINEGKDDKPSWDHLELTTNQRKWLAAYSQTGQKKRACEAAMVTYMTQNTWYRRSKAKEKWPDYMEAYEIAHQLATDLLVDEAMRRGKDGVERMKFYKGMPIMIRCEPNDMNAQRIIDEDGNAIYLKPYVEHEYSDQLLTLLLRSYRPETFTEKQQIENTGSGNAIVLLDMVKALEDKRKGVDVIDAKVIKDKADKFLGSDNAK